LNPPHYFTNTVDRVPNIYIYARNGGNDRAYLNGGDGKGKLKSEEDVSWMYGANYYARAKFFDRVYADGKGGAGDTAIFYDTPDQDVLVAGPGAATVTTGSMVRKASSFESVTVYGASRDTATLSDSTGNDVFDGLSNKSRIAGSGYEIVARGFKTVTATATLGFDKARLYDTAFDDLYECRPGISKLTGGGTTGLAITAQGFDKVSLISTRGGFDTADLYDTPDNDILDAVGWSAKLYRNVGLPELLYEALSVERVRAHGSTGVNARKVAPLVDFALLFDGPWVP